MITSKSMDKSLDWIIRNLAEFDPFLNGRAYQIKHGQKVGELAILAHVYVALTGRGDSSQIKQIVSLLQRVQEKREYIDRLLRSPVEFILFAEVYACLRAIGYDNLDQRLLIQRTLDAHYLEHTERLPHRMMDIASCLEWGGFEHPFPSLDTLYSLSILKHVPFPYLLNEDAIYAVTHVIMFLYGFGVRKNVSVPQSDLVDLRLCLAALLVIVCQEHHWDLLAELLLCWECIGLESTYVYERAWAMLISMQNEDGSIPGPEWAQRLHDQIDQAHTNENERDFYFAHRYHTTLVSVVAGCLRIRRSERPASLVVSDSNNRPNSLDTYYFPYRADAPAYPDNADFVKRTRTWLERLAEALPQRDDVHSEDLCRVLLGIWICNSLVSSPEQTMIGYAQLIGQALADGELDWTKTSATLKLITAAILSSQHVSVPVLHFEDGFLSQAAQFLNKLDVQNVSTDLSLYEKRFLLYQMGLHPKPSQINFESVSTYAHDLKLSASLSEIETLLLYINCLTSYGTLHILSTMDTAWFRELLSGFAMTFLRNYDLLMSCQVLRSMHYLGINDDMYKAGLSFLRTHQGLDGSFGFFGREERNLAGKSSEFSTDSALYLPITIECLWTLSESLDTSWRLYDSIPSQ